MVKFKTVKLLATSICLLGQFLSQRDSDLGLLVEVLLFMVLIELRDTFYENLFDIFVFLGTDFEVRKSMLLLKEFLSLFFADLSVFQVTFVT
jgi:hypothetical protein